MSTVTFKEPKVSSNIVEQILEQGQRLRNSMVQSILNNDPFSSEYLSSSSSSKHNLLDKNVTPEEKELFASYLRGEKLSKTEEKIALESFRAMSNTEITEFTEKNPCTCAICKAFYEKEFIEESRVPPLCLDRVCATNGSSYVNRQLTGESQLITSEDLEHLQYVDSLKISIHSLNLNNEGIKKVYGSSIDVHFALPPTYSHSYFIEYSIPECLRTDIKTKAKVDSRFNPNIVRMCSKKVLNKVIYFKTISFHDIKHLDQIDLNSLNLKFQISSRTTKQKNSNILGCAKFCMGSFEHSKYLSCSQELPLMLNNEAPIVLGSLKISLQLGCGRLYFGKEFIDAISANKENKINSNEPSTQISVENPHQNSCFTSTASFQTLTTGNHTIIDTVEPQEQNKIKTTENKIKTPKSIPTEISAATVTEKEKLPKTTVYGTKLKKAPEKKLIFSKTLVEQNLKDQEKVVIREETNLHDNQESRYKENNCEILFGFIYVSEAHNLEKECNSYFTCHPFSHEDTFYSRLIHCSSDPVYNFQETVPFVCDESFLNLLRDNYMVFEFWEKCDETDSLIGIIKIPLHQFYIAYRNPVIVKYLLTNELPVVGVDWWEPICDPINGRIYGQAQILVALGSETQINNLQSKRGFRKNLVLAKNITLKPYKEGAQKHIQDNTNKLLKSNTKNVQKTTYLKPHITKQAFDKTLENKYRKPTYITYQGHKVEPKTKSAVVTVKTVDKSVQSDLEMEPEKQLPSSQNSDMLGALLVQLMEERKRNTSVENSTNTEDIPKSQPVPYVDEQNTGDKQNDTSQNNHNTITQNPPHVDNLQSANIKKTADLLENLQKALSMSLANSKQQTSITEDKTSFKAHIIIECAMHLPSRKKCKSKKSKHRNAKPEEILPSSYVTFEALPEGELKITPVIQKSTNPNWNYRCDVSLPTDLLTNNQKRLIFKIWRKCNGNSMIPNMQADLILGFAALDLTVLKAGLPTVQGWFNIVDFSSKCNGQIKINVTPLENVSAISKDDNGCGTHITNLFNNEHNISEATEKLDEPTELLSRALKRKFTELDEITQRLRLRLSTVTNEESDVSNDDIADEFERDINTLCVEDDYDMVNFEDMPDSPEKKNNLGLLQVQVSPTDQDNALLQFSESYSSKHANVSNNLVSISQEGTSTNGNSSSNENVHIEIRPEPLNPMDKQILEGKQRIASLLEKLSLVVQNDSSDTFSNRYVSGCSVSTQEAAQSTDILKELGIETGKNFDPDCIINPMLFQELCEGSLESTSQLLTERSNPGSRMESQDITQVSGSASSTSIESSQISRPAPDGAGYCSEDTESSAKSDR